MIPNGATIWARKTTTSDIFSRPDKWFKIWFYMICCANHKDNGAFKRGQCHLTYESIMLVTYATKSQVDHCVRYLKKNGMLATRKATRGFIVTIVNYDLYQNFDNYKSDTDGEMKAKQKRNRSETEAKQKRQDKQECKNDKNVKNDKKVKKFVRPTVQQLEEYSKSISYDLDGQYFIDKYDGNGWMAGKTKMQDWKAVVRTWKKNNFNTGKTNGNNRSRSPRLNEQDWGGEELIES